MVFGHPSEKYARQNWVHLPQFWGKQLKNTVFMIHHPHLNSPEAPVSFETQVAQFWTSTVARRGSLEPQVSRVGGKWIWMNAADSPSGDAKIVSLPAIVSGFSLIFPSFFGCSKKKRPIWYVFSYLTIAVVFTTTSLSAQNFGIAKWSSHLISQKNSTFSRRICSANYTVGLMWNPYSLQ